MDSHIRIRGAKVHNLKNISVDIPKNKLTVITGVSGSGKSSLAFDTLYAEGQRRYVESLSSYARQFLGLMEKPDVESITGLSPAISIDQKTSSSNPRSTVGTVTEIYDYLRLLFGHIGQPHCPNCGKPVSAQSIHEISEQVIELVKKPGTKFQVLSPIAYQKKGTFKDILESLLNDGFIRVKIDGEMHNLDEIEDLKIDKNKKHDVDLVVDRLVLPEGKRDDEEFIEFEKRLVNAIELATSKTEGEVKIDIDGTEHFFSESNTCFECKVSFPKIKAASFSFNSPHGACDKCAGLGYLKEIDIERIYNPRLTIAQGGIFPWANKTTTESWTKRTLDALAEAHGFDLKTPLGDYSQEIIDLIFYAKGAKDSYDVQYTNRFGNEKTYETTYEGVVPQMERRYKESTSQYIRSETEKFMDEKACSVCDGKRLKPYSLSVTINDNNIDDVSKLPIKAAKEFTLALNLEGNEADIAEPIIREIGTRLQFLESVGLNYLTLERKANTLSGGEAQRIRLASQIGTGLTGVLYVLDEPSIGLHSRDVSRLIGSLTGLRDIGNTVVVVEHDHATMESADHIIDIGPGAGVHGGQIVQEGTLKEIKQTESLTAKYLTGSLSVGQDLDGARQLSTEQKTLILSGAKTHNLQDLEVSIPLGNLICITGVSGSGKSSLINDTLYPVLMNAKMNGKQKEGEYSGIEGLEHVDKVIGIDQSPIGRTPRSNPATYTGIFDHIRKLFAETAESRARGYKQGRYSFNVKGGRCEKCQGDGQIKIEMQFLADMYVTCETCRGSRYNKDTLQIDYKGRNIAEVLDMTVEEAAEFFTPITPIKRRLDVLLEVGLGYIKLGQSATTLSGGESQRIKLSKELSKMTRGHTIYILDEPTTGLHFHDVDKLLGVLKKLVDKGNTVMVIEHNMDIIKWADWIIDMGPEGGEEGGKVIAQGTVQDLIKAKGSYTGEYLKKYLGG